MTMSHNALLQSTFLFVSHQTLSNNPTKPSKNPIAPRETFATLYPNRIEFRTLSSSSPPKDQILEIPLSRLVAANLTDDATTLSLYTIVKSPKKSKGRFSHLATPKCVYRRMQWVLRTLDSREGHLEEMRLWHRVLNYDILVGLERFGASKQEGDTPQVTKEQLQALKLPHEEPNGRPRKLLVLINPKSGPGIAKKTFALYVKPVLDIAPLEYRTILTTHAQHATEICQQINMHDYDGIVTVGGDGIIFECLQGMMRNASREGRLLPISVIGAGTSNGLATDLGAGHPLAAARIAARGRLRFVDMFSFWQNDQVYYAFLTVTFALVADVDIGTEFMRAIGSLRNIVGGIGCVLRKRMYEGELQFVSIPREDEAGGIVGGGADEKDASTTNDEDSACRTVFSDVEGFGSFSAAQQESTTVEPTQSQQDGQQPAPLPNSPANALVPSFLLHYFPEEFKNTCPKWYNFYMSGEAQPDQVVLEENAGDTAQDIPVQEDTTLATSASRPYSRFLDDLEWKQSLMQKIPKDHVQQFREKYLYFVASNVPHMAHDMVASPLAMLNNGKMDIIRVTKSVPTMKLLKVFTQMEDGSYLDAIRSNSVQQESTAKAPMMQHDQCVAFVFKPIRKGSYLVLDGENMAYSSALVEVHRRVLPFMVDEECTFTEHL